MKRLCISLLLCVQLPLLAQSIEKFSIDSGGASATAGGIEILYTIGEVNLQEYNHPSMIVSEGFINSNIKIKIVPKLFLQGPLLNPVSAGLMNDDLRQNELIPTTSPYADGAICNASVFSTTGNNAIVDWVWLELRAANDNQKLINGKSALLQRDGDIVDLDGTSYPRMLVPKNNYFVVLSHRNHLGAMTANSINLNTETSNLIDFTNNSMNTFGSNAQVILNNGSLALWAGDTSNSNFIRFSGANNNTNVIKDYVLGDQDNILGFITFPSMGYLNTDIDLNGIARFSGPESDSNIIKDIILSFPGNILGLITLTINGSVPPITNN